MTKKVAPRARFELATLRLTVEGIKNLNALSGVAYTKRGAISLFTNRAHSRTHESTGRDYKCPRAKYETLTPLVAKQHSRFCSGGFFLRFPMLSTLWGICFQLNANLCALRTLQSCTARNECSASERESLTRRARHAYEEVQTGVNCYAAAAAPQKQRPRERLWLNLQCAARMRGNRVAKRDLASPDCRLPPAFAGMQRRRKQGQSL